MTQTPEERWLERIRAAGTEFHHELQEPLEDEDRGVRMLGGILIVGAVMVALVALCVLAWPL